MSRIKLRSFTVDDRYDFFELSKEEETTRFLTWEHHKDVKDALWSIENIFLPNKNAFAIELIEEKKCIGSIDLRLDDKNNKASFGYVLNRAYWGRGYMTEALKEILRIAFEEYGVNKVESTHYLGNEASGAVMKKCGMKYEGTIKEEVLVKGKYHDVLHYGILKREWS